MPTHVVILGAGFGGLELASRLSEQLADEVQVTLIDRSDSFVFGFAKLDVMFGRRSLDEVSLPYRDIAKPGVEFRQETVVSIDPERRHVVTDRATYDADVLVVALGADLDPGATPGLAEGGYEFYSPAGADRARDALASLDSGVVLIGVLGPQFKCPPAPNEAAFLLHDLLSARGVRDAVTIRVLSPLAQPIPISDETSAAIVSRLAERDIEYWPKTTVTHLDPGAKVAHLADGREVAYDLFLAVPIHRAPAVVVEAGLTEDGWIPVDRATFATRFPHVYAVGDITSAPVPRAGVIAEGEAGTVADVLVARLAGGEAPAPYAGGAVCYIELGGDQVGRVDVTFPDGGAARARFSPPSAESAEAKRQFGPTRQARWFGHS